MHKAKILLLVILAILIIIVIVQNTQAVETKILFITVTMPRVVLLLVTLLVGFVLGLVTPFSLAGRKRRSTG